MKPLKFIIKVNLFSVVRIAIRLIKKALKRRKEDVSEKMV